MDRLHLHDTFVVSSFADTDGRSSLSMTVIVTHKLQKKRE